jgi:hypothetical protein
VLRARKLALLRHSLALLRRRTFWSWPGALALLRRRHLLSGDLGSMARLNAPWAVLAEALGTVPESLARFHGVRTSSQPHADLRKLVDAIVRTNGPLACQFRGIVDLQAKSGPERRPKTRWSPFGTGKPCPLRVRRMRNRRLCSSRLWAPREHLPTVRGAGPMTDAEASSLRRARPPAVKSRPMPRGTCVRRPRPAATSHPKLPPEPREEVDASTLLACAAGAGAAPSAAWDVAPRLVSTSRAPPSGTGSRRAA